MGNQLLAIALRDTRSTLRSSHRAALIITLFVIGLATAAAGQQDRSPIPPSESSASQQTPDAPSSIKQGGSVSHGVVAVAKTIGQDEWHLISAPFRINSLGFTDKTPFVNKTLFWDSVVIGSTAVLIANDESVAKQVNPAWHQSSTNISNGLTYGTAATAGGIYLTGLFTHDQHAQRTGVLSAEAAIDSFLLYGGMKLIFNRDRPYTGAGDGKFFAGNFSSGSFPSGHSALAWTLASVVAHEYPKWPVALAMYGMATTVATTRVMGGQHFPSDVFVGSTLGYLVGRYVANKDKQAQTPVLHSGNPLKRIPNAILEHVAVQ
jgi:membrane-associated phospholipid phosphatase